MSTTARSPSAAAASRDMAVCIPDVGNKELSGAFGLKTQLCLSSSPLQALEDHLCHKSCHNKVTGAC